MSKSKKRKPNSGNPAKPRIPKAEPNPDGWWTWVRTEPTLDGSTYILTMEFDEDKALALVGPTQVFGYIAMVMDACTRAEYDAAVFAQMTKIDKDGGEENALQVVRDLRDDRPELPVLNGLLELAPGVNDKRHPFLTIRWNGEDFAQWDIPDAKQHAMHVLEAFTVADHDAAYLRYLRGVISLEEDVARGVVHTLQDFR